MAEDGAAKKKNNIVGGKAQRKPALIIGRLVPSRFGASTERKSKLVNKVLDVGSRINLKWSRKRKTPGIVKVNCDLHENDDESSFAKNGECNNPNNTPQVDIKYSSSILNNTQHYALNKSLPYRKRDCYWHTLYSSDKDGFGLLRLYKKATGKNQTVLVIRTVSGDVFGVYATESWRENGKRYYGTGEMFIFSCSDNNSLAKNLNSEDQCNSPCKIYRWAGTNENFLSTSEKHLSVGGGSKGFAFWLDENFSGSSYSSETFDNPTLVSSPDHFFQVQSCELFSLEESQEKVS